MRYLLLLLILTTQVNAMVDNPTISEMVFLNDGTEMWSISDSDVHGLILGDKVIVDKDYETVSLKYHKACIKEYEDKFSLYLVSLEVIISKLNIANSELKTADKYIKILTNRIKKKIIINQKLRRKRNE